MKQKVSDSILKHNGDRLEDNTKTKRSTIDNKPYSLPCGAKA